MIPSVGEPRSGARAALQPRPPFGLGDSGTPRWRVAIVRPPGSFARVDAHAIAGQFRDVGSMAVEIASGGRSGALSEQVAQAADAKAYNLVVALGDSAPIALALALAADAPLFSVPVPPAIHNIPAAVEAAVADESFRLRALMEVQLDGRRPRTGTRLQVIGRAIDVVWGDSLDDAAQSSGADIEATRDGLLITVDAGAECAANWCRVSSDEGVDGLLDGVSVRADRISATWAQRSVLVLNS